MNDITILDRKSMLVKAKLSTSNIRSTLILVFSPSQYTPILAYFALSVVI